MQEQLETFARVMAQELLKGRFDVEGDELGDTLLDLGRDGWAISAANAEEGDLDTFLHSVEDLLHIAEKAANAALGVKSTAAIGQAIVGHENRTQDLGAKEYDMVGYVRDALTQHPNAGLVSCKVEPFDDPAKGMVVTNELGRWSISIENQS